MFLGCGGEIERLREAGIIPADMPPLGHSLVMDSTDVEAWAKPSRTSRKTGEEIPSKDPDAAWGHRTAKTKRSSKASKRRTSKKKNEAGDGGDTGSGEKDSKDELFFGYKVNVIADANYGLPMFARTRPANASDYTVMIEDLDACLALYPELRKRYFLGDKGYDSQPNIQHVVDRGMIPVIAVRMPTKDKETGKRLYDGIHDQDGRPTCVGGKSMEYVETDQEGFHHFQCPAEGCHLKDSVQFTRHCDYAHYEKPEGKLLRIVGLLPRCSDEWIAEYKKRPGIERCFSSVKHSRMLDKHRCLNGGKMTLHAVMSILSYLATALAHLEADDYAHVRHMRIKLPKARGERRRQPRPAPACRDPDCACCNRLRETV